MCPKCGITQSASLTADSQDLNRWFKIWWICLAVTLPLCLIFIGFATLIVSVVFYCFLLHKLWKIIPVEKAITTPGRAVGLQFVPLFNFYWIFVAFHGLGKALNDEMSVLGIKNREVNQGLTLAFCILYCFQIIPYISFLTSIVGFVFFCITFKQMKDAGVAIFENGTERVPSIRNTQTRLSQVAPQPSSRANVSSPPPPPGKARP